MMNIFPTVFLSMLAYFILRGFAGVLLLSLGMRHIKKDREMLRASIATHWPYFARISGFLVLKLAVIEILIGAMFIVGAYTQIAALIGFVFSFKMLLSHKCLPYPLMPPPFFWVLMLAVCASLFITGAGAFALDLPI